MKKPTHFSLHKALLSYVETAYCRIKRAAGKGSLVTNIRRVESTMFVYKDLRINKSVQTLTFFKKSFCTVLRTKPRTSHMLSKLFTTELHPRPCFES